MASIAVIGAGVVGLSTASAIKKMIPNAQITIIAKDFQDDTTSIGAAGVFRPMPNKKLPLAKDPEIEKLWYQDSAHHFWSLAYSKKSSKAGIYPVSMYVLSDEEISGDIISTTTRGFRRLTAEELREWPTFRTGINSSTFIIENRFYLPYLMEQLTRSEHVSVEQKSVKELSELNDDFDLLVNCSGLGAAQLVGDTNMVPIRGQVFRVAAPWIKYAVTDAGGTTYVYPNSGSIVVGGVRQEGNYSKVVSRADSEDIWRRAHEMVPSLAGCRVLSEWVGLRPGRLGGVRNELEMIDGHPVVHNYGHAGSGVALSWGTAMSAARLAKQAVSETMSRL